MWAYPSSTEDVGALAVGHAWQGRTAGVYASAGEIAAGASGAGGLANLALDFGGLAASRRAWRQPLFADWELKLAGKTYRVHRTILAQGERMSHFFLAQFERWEDSGSCTNLDSLLPEPCWLSFEGALDYVYDGTLALEPAAVIPTLKIAHMLQIPSLGAACVAFLRASLSQSSAPTVLASALQLGPGLEPIIAECASIMAREFDSYPCEVFTRFPSQTLHALLGHPRLRASPEHLSRVAAAYIRSMDQVGLPELKEAFGRFSAYMKEIQPKDAVFLLVQAVRLGHRQCRTTCLRAVAQHFAHVDIGELAEIPDHATLVELLDDDELAMRDEDQILEAIARYTSAQRGMLTDDQVEECWAACRFADLTATGWERVLSLEGGPAWWLKLGMAARLSRAEQGEAAYEAFVARHGSQAGGLAARRLRRRRRHSELHFLHFSSPFDKNGVLYWIGSRGGTRPYANPHESGDVVVTFSRRGTGKESHFVQHVNSSQDCHTDDEKFSWMQVDLGPSRSLRPNYYCLRHGLRLNEYCLRSWQLQGSNDGSTWTVLDDQENDFSLTGGGFSTAAWGIESKDGASYRVFRILQTGPSHSSCSDNLRVACAGIELYGDLYQQL
jgi:hypothetical protein